VHPDSSPAPLLRIEAPKGANHCLMLIGEFPKKGEPNKVLLKGHIYYISKNTVSQKHIN
jgi:hypothetical protein